jgi:hypothetical protein
LIGRFTTGVTTLVVTIGAEYTAAGLAFRALGFVINFLIGFAFMRGFDINFFATLVFAAAFDLSIAFGLALIFAFKLTFDFTTMTHILSFIIETPSASFLTIKLLHANQHLLPG